MLIVDWATQASLGLQFLSQIIWILILTSGLPVTGTYLIGLEYTEWKNTNSIWKSTWGIWKIFN